MKYKQQQQRKIFQVYHQITEFGDSVVKLLFLTLFSASKVLLFVYSQLLMLQTKNCKQGREEAEALTVRYSTTLSGLCVLVTQSYYILDPIGISFCFFIVSLACIFMY